MFNLFIYIIIRLKKKNGSTKAYPPTSNKTLRGFRINIFNAYMKQNIIFIKYEFETNKTMKNVLTSN